jgi:signal peptidase II
MRQWNYLLISLAVLAADQASKAHVAARFSYDTAMEVIPGFLRLVRVENRGIAFGMFSDSASPAVSRSLVLIAAVALILIIALLWHNHPSARLTNVGLALILGGAAGNLFDRLTRGHVVDFLDVYVGTYHWPAFNIADSAITAGAAALLWDMLLARRPAKKQEARS